MPTASDVSRLLKLNLEMEDFSAFVPFIRNGFPRQCFDVKALSGETISNKWNKGTKVLHFQVEFQQSRYVGSSRHCLSLQ